MNRIPTLPRTDLQVPPSLELLKKIALNMHWAWNREALDLLREIDPVRFDAGLPPVSLLRESAKIERLSKDAAYIKRVEHVAGRLQAYLDTPDREWKGMSHEHPAAYFCAEYGIHESFAQYCGGLGILAGDHCKEASDQHLPFLGIGIFYRLGYFRQSIDQEGRQEHVYTEFDYRDHALQRVADPKTGAEMFVELQLPGRVLRVAVWCMAIGRVPLLLLDTNIPENASEDRAISAQLYMLGRETRFLQELVLGVGGARVLSTLGIEPGVCHMNEGHSALLLVERLREMVSKGASWPKACKEIQQRSVLTIHTPVPEGNERFDTKLVKMILEPIMEGSSIKVSTLLKMGRDSVNDPNVFDMTAFALRLSKAANGVSILHGSTAHNTWHPVVGRPVGAVTNGVHMPTWLGPQVRALYEGVGATFEPATALVLTARKQGRSVWSKIEEVDDEALWLAHVSQKRALIEFANARLVKHHVRHGESPTQLKELASYLDPDAFIIGFARRFAPYKRAGLLFTDSKRILRLLRATGRPVQIIYSGKAHPGDRVGQGLIKDVFEKTLDPQFKGKVFVLEDHDIAVGKALVQGVDLWINNPLRPLEASGTSGMKAAANGVPNASILDGWWDEAFEAGTLGQNGFAVGRRENQKGRAEQDRFDAESLYRVLEREVAPLYWQRDERGVPTGWLSVMKQAIATSLYAFSTVRMLEDYARDMYSDAD
ncbi:MAG: alpha-glucan family phosphorylase [Fimbriimonas sp.]|nr:alpha-glucan family phosphorylase [Fimbriimonas sp.]